MYVSELRKFWHFYILKLLFLSYLSLHSLANHLYTMVEFYWGGGEALPSPPPVRQWARAINSVVLLLIIMVKSRLNYIFCQDWKFGMQSCGQIVFAKILEDLKVTTNMNIYRPYIKKMQLLFVGSDRDVEAVDPGGQPPPMKILGGGANISFCPPPPPNNFDNLKNNM